MKNLNAEVTDKILASLKSGVIPWRKPWSSIGSGNMPRNAVSNRAYSGGNVVLLWMRAQQSGYGLPLWLTYKQAVELGGSVRKGEKGTMVVFASVTTFKDKTTSEDRSTFIFRSYTVFNVAQCDGLPAFDKPKIVNPDERDALADEFVKATDARITYGGEAFYSRAIDTVNLPTFESFKNSSSFYATAFHELAHWTGAESRLNRVKGKRFGDREYAYEELVAELTSAFVCAEFGFDNDTVENSASYIQHWIKVLEDHDKFFMAAASDASKALEYMRTLVTRTDVEMAA